MKDSLLSETPPYPQNGQLPQLPQYKLLQPLRINKRIKDQMKEFLKEKSEEQSKVGHRNNRLNQSIDYNSQQIHNTFSGHSQNQNLSFSVDYSAGIQDYTQYSKQSSSFITPLETNSHYSKSTLPSTVKNVKTGNNIIPTTKPQSIFNMTSTNVSYSNILKQADEVQQIQTSSQPVQTFIPEEVSVTKQSYQTRQSLQTINEFNNTEIYLQTDGISLLEEQIDKDQLSTSQSPISRNLFGQSRNALFKKSMNLTEIIEKRIQEKVEKRKFDEFMEKYQDDKVRKRKGGGGGVHVDYMNSSNFNVTRIKKESKSKYKFGKESISPLAKKKQVFSQSPNKPQHTKELKERYKFMELVMFMKGLNDDYKEQKIIDHLEDRFERRLTSQNIKINKEQVLSQIHKTFYNKTFLQNLKKQKQNLDNTLQNMGLNLDAYRAMAKNIIHRDQYEKHKMKLLEEQQKTMQEQFVDDSDQDQDNSKEELNKKDASLKKLKTFDVVNQQIQDIYNCRTKRKRNSIKFSQSPIFRTQTMFFNQTIDDIMLQKELNPNDEYRLKLTKRMKKRKLQSLALDNVDINSRQVNHALLKTNDNFLKHKLKIYKQKCLKDSTDINDVIEIKHEIKHD